jgi:allantoin racemase
MRLLLVNPNTNTQTTAMMASIAGETLLEGKSAGDRESPLVVDSLTVTRGVSLITDDHALAEAALAVSESLAALDTQLYQGIVVSAFGDPGLARARALTSTPITGIAEAAMAEAPGRFAVVTTTPGLVDSITQMANRYGHSGRFAGVHLTPGDPASLMADPNALLAAMLSACRAAIDSENPDSIVIGGGPLARIARALKPLLPLPVIEPIPAAIRLAKLRAGVNS